MLRKEVSWKYITLRRALLSALLLLGCWGVVSSLYQVRQSWRDYQRSNELVEWAKIAGQIMTAAQHFAYERGRTAVVLSAPESISNDDRKFIDERRLLADRTIAALYEKVATLPDVGHEAFYEKWQKVREIRRQVDADSALPRAHRDPELVARWTHETTAFMMQTEVLGRHLIRYYRQTEGANRLNTLGFLSFRLRMLTGSEASVIARQVASKKPMPEKDIYVIHEMRGTQKALWYEMDRTLEYLGNAQMKVMATHLKKHQSALRAIQDEALSAWMVRRKADVPLEDLTAASVPLLDGFSDLMSHAIQEANRTAKQKMESSQSVLLSHIALAISVMIVMMLAIFYVLVKVVRPLEAVDATLRQLHHPDAKESHVRLNEVERLRETAAMLQQVFAEKALLENKLRDLAFFDPLTQLPNRRLLEDRLHQKILRAKRHNTLLALLFIDLDDFKPVNDAFGHEVGDWVLRVVAERITSCLRESDTVSRQGGDEFVVLLPDLTIQQAAIEVAEKICEALAQPFLMENGEQLSITSSIGIAVYPLDAENEQELLRLGDIAMYAAKTNGGNRLQIAQPENG